MFTGIVEEIGTVRHATPAGAGMRMEIACARVLEGLAVDHSVNVAGACLTVVARDDRSFTADVVPETLARTTLGRAVRGTHLNLERAATLGTPLGGHLVQGHVDGTATLEARTPEGEGARLWFSLAPPLGRYVVEKGYISLDGVSLTVSALRPGAFEVALVPHTVRRTTLESLREGDHVNVEVDIIGKYVERLLEAKVQKP